MTVVSNSTPLIGLSILNHTDLLRVLFGEIHIPRAVFEELTIKGANRVGAQEVAAGVSGGWVHVEEVPSSSMLTTLKIDLDDGEAEAIALAFEHQAELLLMDERKGRAKAKALGLEITGTIGVLLLARAKGVEVDLRSELEQLREHGFRISEKLLHRILQENSTR